MSDGPQITKEAMQTREIGAQAEHVWGTWPPQSKADANQLGGAAMTLVRAILVDDQLAARRSLRRGLRFEPHLEVVGEANNAEAGVALAQEQRPDIVVMGMEMPVIDGLQAAKRLHTLAPDCVIILLTIRDSVETHQRARTAGARVVIEKGNPEVFRNAFNDLAQFVKARNAPAWPESDAAYAR